MQRFYQRKKEFPTFNYSELKLKREQNYIELRKSKRAQNSDKRRFAQIPEPDPENPFPDQNAPKLQLAKTIRALVCQNPQIPETSAVVPQLVSFMQETSSPELVYESTWALTNLAAGDNSQTLCIVNQGAIPVLVSLLDSPQPKIADQAIWAIANISADNPYSRDLVVKEGGLSKLLKHLTKGVSVWALANILRTRPYLHEECLEPAISKILSILHQLDDNLVKECLWALASNSDGRPYIIVNSDALEKLVDFAQEPYLEPLLRILGNVACGDHEQTQSIITPTYLAAIKKGLNSSCKFLRREAAWIVSNISAGPTEHLEQLYKSGIYCVVVKKVMVDFHQIKREGVWTMVNCIANSNSELLDKLLSIGFLEKLCGVLCSTEAIVVFLGLEGVHRCLKKTNTQKAFKKLEDCGGLFMIEKLHSHKNSQIRKKSHQIISEFFQEQPESPLQLTQATFTFNI
mmetsp:Transcript_589/g.978  ORF Transcript_589/g.978 Transcript_589/m.978 type:complete len:460 (-) Transcript_589:1326-2705(-)